MNALQLIESNRPLVIAHRGYSQLAPENTAPAFEFALATGADLIELDYRHSHDGIPLVFHDATLQRIATPTGRGEPDNRAIADCTATELQRLDIGSWFAPRYAGTPPLSLEIALDLIQTGSTTLIERKSGNAQTCVSLLRKKNLVNRVVVQSFDWDFLRDCRALCPELVLGALGPSNDHAPGALDAEHLDNVAALGAQIAVWNSQVSAEAVEYAHRKGLRVWAYTINSIEAALTLLERGLDGLISDNPALIWKALALRKHS